MYDKRVVRLVSASTSLSSKRQFVLRLQRHPSPSYRTPSRLEMRLPRQRNILGTSFSSCSSSAEVNWLAVLIMAMNAHPASARKSRSARIPTPTYRRPMFSKCVEQAANKQNRAILNSRCKYFAHTNITRDTLIVNDQRIRCSPT